MCLELLDSFYNAHSKLRWEKRRAILMMMRGQANRSRAAMRRRGRRTGAAADLLVVGLGNPGDEYASTRHNAGVWVVDELVRQKHKTPPSYLQGHCGDANAGDRDHWIGSAEKTARSGSVAAEGDAGSSEVEGHATPAMLSAAHPPSIARTAAFEPFVGGRVPSGGTSIRGV